MPEWAGIGRAMLLLGVVLVLLGLAFIMLERWPAAGGSLRWIGRLPGDVLIKRENFTFYFPLATSVLLSVILSLLVWLFFRR